MSVGRSVGRSAGRSVGRGRDVSTLVAWEIPNCNTAVRLKCCVYFAMYWVHVFRRDGSFVWAIPVRSKKRGEKLCCFVRKFRHIGEVVYDIDNHREDLWDKWV